MVLCVKVALRNAERVKRALTKRGVLDTGWRYTKDDTAMYFPVTEQFTTQLPLAFVEHDLVATERKKNLRDALAANFTPAELERLKRAYDVVGSIAIVEIDAELKLREGEIAAAVLATQQSVRTVLAKAGGHEGELRLQRYRFLAGEDTRETTVMENGVRLRINVEAVYYSIRSATERKRIAALVLPGERVLVMFSGAAPYPCVLAKHTKATEIVGIELNETGHELGLASLKLNKMKNVTLIHGDVKDVVPELAARHLVFDRIVMPLPHTGHDFLDEAFSVAKKGTVIHLYDFEREGEFEQAAEKAVSGAKRNTCDITVLGVTPSGQHSPRLYRVCVDILVVNCRV